ncbi:hypothetical protein [Sporolactobacillus nakayamae]|uniref:hypothetical protein n=1 Tax=Sporolactobacillus nakayamae TaxID=269670 RepID=UPI000B84A5A2|nr:hypothetical protein [Sporolactobacillus nakayamae]
MYKLIEFFKYIILVCYWKVTDLWKKARGKKTSNNSDFMSEQRTNPTLLNIEDTHSLFASPPRDATIFMSKPIFEKIVHLLPTNYVLPDLETLKIVTDIYNQHETTQEEPQQNDDQVHNKIKTTLPNVRTLSQPPIKKVSRPSEPTNQHISIVKTFTPNVAPELAHISSLDRKECSTKQKAESDPALRITPLQSKKKIIKPAERKDDVTQNNHYKFVFIK